MTDRTCERCAFSIAEFCLRNGIALSTYFKLKRESRGPREMRVFSAVRISLEAERDWRAAREQPSGEEARQIARADRARHARATRAGKLAAASPEHISKRRQR